jgi:hypothetical protein
MGRDERRGGRRMNKKKAKSKPRSLKSEGCGTRLSFVVCLLQVFYVNFVHLKHCLPDSF